MAEYQGAVYITGSLNIGNKRLTILRLAISNYNTPGIPLGPHDAAMGIIEAVGLLAVEGSLDDNNSPTAASYDRSTGKVRLFSFAGTEILANTNIYSISGYVYLIVIGA